MKMALKLTLGTTMARRHSTMQLLLDKQIAQSWFCHSGQGIPLKINACAVASISLWSKAERKR